MYTSLINLNGGTGRTSEIHLLICSIILNKMSKRVKEIRFNLVAWLIAGNMFVIFRFWNV
jgi:hypothetical protein